MAQLAPQTIVYTGLTPALAAAAAGGDKFLNTGREFVSITNASGAEITLTIVTQTAVEGLALPDRTVAIPAAGSRLIGPFSASIYNDVDGNVNLTYSGVTTLTVGVIKLP